jgi:DHA1 family multidrug/chloramphenicol efflux transport protein-like MFS transporter
MTQKLRLQLFALALVIYEFTGYAANDMIMPNMLDVVHEFHAPLEYVATSLSLYILGSPLIQLFLGPLSDRFGKRIVIICGNIIFLIFTLLVAFSVNTNMFMLGRALQGMGLAFIAMGYSIIHENFDDKQAVKITALMGNVAILAPILGPILGGFIGSHTSWRFIFIFSGITGLISLIGLIKFTPLNKTPSKPLNFKNAITGYYKILIQRSFFVGVCSIGFMCLPILWWIAFAPTLIMHTLNLKVTDYMLYQAIAASGILANTLITHIIAGRIKMATIILCGLICCISGIFTGIMLHNHILAISIGMFIFGLGLGLLNGINMRIIAKLETESPNMLYSLMAFINCLILSIGIEIGNKILHLYNYSILSFVIMCGVMGLFATIFVLRFAYMNRNRVWQ